MGVKCRILPVKSHQIQRTLHQGNTRGQLLLGKLLASSLTAQQTICVQISTRPHPPLGRGPGVVISQPKQHGCVPSQEQCYGRPEVGDIVPSPVPTLPQALVLTCPPVCVTGQDAQGVNSEAALQFILSQVRISIHNVILNKLEI